jgi:hypothetical protein
MSRGMRLFKVPREYASTDAVTASGLQQFRDVVAVEPVDYNDKMSIWQYLYNQSGELHLYYIKNIDYTFTDNTIVPNVTPARKAHHDDYRTLLNSFSQLYANKYGDTFYGKHDFGGAKIRWELGSDGWQGLTSLSAELYASWDTYTMNLDYSTSIKFNSITPGYVLINTIMQLDQNHIFIWKDTDITGNLKIKAGGTDDETDITNTTITTTNINAVNTVTTNLDTAIGTIDDLTSLDFVTNTMRAVSSTSTTMVTSLNADMLDDFHLANIIDLIPQLNYDPDHDYAIKNYFTLLPGETKNFTAEYRLGHRMSITLNNITYYMPAVESTDLEGLESCTCTCTCTCQCPCTCTCTGPCNCCNGSGPI